MCEGQRVLGCSVDMLVPAYAKLTRPGGRVNVFVGLAGRGRAEIEANLIHYRQLTVTGSSAMRRADYETALGLITSGRVDTASMVTHRFPLRKVDDAFRAAAAREAVKVAVLPRE